MELHDFEIVEKDREIDQYICVQILVRIRKNDTGEVREYKDYAIWEDDFANDGLGQPSLFIWQEGNYACDCNRYLFFQRSANEEEDLDKKNCGDDKYSVQIYNPKNGEILYNEFE